jgi:hypothetical protein
VTIQYTRETLDEDRGVYRLTVSDPDTGLSVSRVLDEQNADDWADVENARALWQGAAYLAALEGRHAMLMQQAAAVQRIFRGAVFVLRGRDVHLERIDLTSVD